MPTLSLTRERVEATGIDELPKVRYWKKRRNPRENIQNPEEALERERRIRRAQFQRKSGRGNGKERLGTGIKTEWVLSRPSWEMTLSPTGISGFCSESRAEGRPGQKTTHRHAWL